MSNFLLSSLSNNRGRHPNFPSNIVYKKMKSDIWFVIYTWAWDWRSKKFKFLSQTEESWIGKPERAIYNVLVMVSYYRLENSLSTWKHEGWDCSDTLDVAAKDRFGS